MDINQLFSPTGLMGRAELQPPKDNGLGKMLSSYLSKQGIINEKGENVIDRAIFARYLRDLKEVDNQLQASEWSSLITQANAWTR